MEVCYNPVAMADVRFILRTTSQKSCRMHTSSTATIYARHPPTISSLLFPSSSTSNIINSHPVLSHFLPHLHDFYKHYDTLSANIIINYDLEFVAGCVLETVPGL